MDLYLLRHGEAGKRLSLADRDAARALTVEGRREVERIATAIAMLDLKFDRIVASPLNRSKETAERVAKALKTRQKVECWDELRPEGDKKAFFMKLAKLGHGSRVLVVGHEPYLTTIASDMIGARGGRILLKKAGLMRIRLEAFLPAPKGELRWLLSPRVMKGIDR